MRAKQALKRWLPAVTIAGSVALAGCSGRVEPAPLDPETSAELLAWLDDNGSAPIEYVLTTFERHDVVILGEPHRFRDHPLLVQDLIPRLSDQGVRILATEFARAADQPLIDRLLDSTEWDEALARRIQLRQYSLWPWREYLDIFKAAWRYNQSLDGTAAPFRILGLNCDPDWSEIRTTQDLQDPDKRRAAWKGCSEDDWADALLREIEAGEKALAYTGMHHAFSGYRQPRVDAEGVFLGWGDIRFGNHLRERLGDRVFTIALHYPWYERTSQYDRWTLRPVDGAIDQVMSTRTGVARPIGFDVTETPFGRLADSRSIYAVGYDGFELSDFCDGYIYFRPFAETELVTFIEGFYDNDNIEDARLSVSNPRYREASPEDFESRMKRQLTRDRKRLRKL